MADIEQRRPAMLSGTNQDVSKVDPDERRPKYYGGSPAQSSGIREQIKKDIKIVGEKIEDVAEGVERGVRKVGEKASEAAHEVGAAAKQAGRKIEGAVECTVDKVCHGKFPWLHVVVAGVVVLVAVKILRGDAK